MVKNLKNKRRAGMYWLENKPYLSVTTILQVINKGFALDYWKAKQVYLACMANPEISEKEATLAPYHQSNTAKDRGLTVHSIIEAYNASGCTIVSEVYQGYLEQFKLFIEAFNAKIIESEKTVVNHTHRYAGTLDLIVELKGKAWILDIKTGKNIYQEAKLQLSAYRECFKQNEIEGVGVILLQEDGYKFETYTETKKSFSAFLGSKELYEYLNEEDLKKLGYFYEKK